MTYINDKIWWFINKHCCTRHFVIPSKSDSYCTSVVIYYLPKTYKVLAVEKKKVNFITGNTWSSWRLCMTENDVDKSTYRD